MRKFHVSAAGPLLAAALLAFGSAPAHAVLILGPGTAENLNDSIATAVDISRSAFGIAASDEVGNAALPRVRIEAAMGANSDVDVYAVTLQADERLIMDIDYAFFPTITISTVAGTGFDAQMFLFNSAGGLLSAVDDANQILGGTGSIHPFDSYLEFTVATAGTYYIAVDSFNNDNPLGGGIGNYAGGDYVLQLSITPTLASIGFGATPQTIFDGEAVFVEALPEPATAALLALAVPALAAIRRRPRR